MYSSLSKGISLFIILTLATFTIFSVNEIDAQEKVVDAQSIVYEKTTIIEFENIGETEIQSFRIWLGEDNLFKSFKTEKGWTGNKNPQEVIVFTTSEPIKLGESVKFGIKTDNASPAIIWKALDKNNEELEIGKTLVAESTSKPSTGEGIFSDSVFRLIPEKPNVASTIRVTGDKFASNQEYNFYIGSMFLDSFETDENGHFIFTTRLPEEQKADRVDFIVKDDDGNQKSISLRIGEGESRVVEDVRLTITGLPSKVNRGDIVMISGTGKPSSAITANIRTPDGEILTREAIDIDPNGKWTFHTIIPINTPLGEYEAEITDGENTILKSWIVESSKTIHITPFKIKYDAGDLLKFNGTALPGQDIEIIFEGPQGIEHFSDVIKTDDDGFFDFQIQSEHYFIDGTYVLFGFQGESSEIVFVGLGVLPEQQLVAKMDKLNYNVGDKAIISISGPESTLTLLIIDPSDTTRVDDSIVLGPDGTKDYELDLEGYSTGIYTTVIKLANSQTSELFSVGLKSASDRIQIAVTKDSYEPGDSILILGEYPKTILLTLTLLDPNGNEIRIKETFSNNDGGLSLSNTFKLPSDAEPGLWTVKATSGAHLDEVQILVSEFMQEGIQVFVDDVLFVPELGVNTVLIKVTGVEQAVTIEILDDENKLIDEITTLSPTSEGIILIPWPIPNDLPPGTYTIRVSDGTDTAETILIVEL